MSMPKGKHIFGTVKVGERGQIVIPKEARELFDINPGDTLLVLGDEEPGLGCCYRCLPGWPGRWYDRWRFHHR